MYSSESIREAALVASGCVSSKCDASLVYHAPITRYGHAKHNTREHFACCFLFQILRNSQNIPSSYTLNHQRKCASFVLNSSLVIIYHYCLNPIQMSIMRRNLRMIFVENWNMQIVTVMLHI